jgi:hypothetical protein
MAHENEHPFKPSGALHLGGGRFGKLTSKAHARYEKELFRCPFP